MKVRYVLFSGTHYYPFGGIHDMQGASDSLEQLKRELRDSLKDKSIYQDDRWFHVVDMTTFDIVYDRDMAERDNDNEESF